VAQATVQTQHGGILSRAATEEISVQALWEGAWPTKLANTILPPFVVLMRLTMGWIFLYSGLDKLINGFSAGGFLVNATKGPLGGWFQGLGENQMALDVINPLVVWGEILIGLALVFGVTTRFAAFWGAVMMFMFYIAQFPPEHNPFMEYYLVYILVLGMLGALGAGRILGLDAVIERLPWVRKIPGVSYLLG
jgi:thiosulfate dehydrogenase [quinone] large subunit